MKTASRIELDLCISALALIVGCGALCGCGDSGSLASADMATQPDLALVSPPLGMPLATTAGKWTWVDFPDSFCDDATHTGIGVNPSATGSKNLLVFLMGGGACWDYSTCYGINAATHGPIGAPQFNSVSSNFNGSQGVLSRDAGSPFADWNLVFVPYCTGDVHAGDNIANYMGPNGSRTFYHKGRVNFDAFMKRVAATWTTPEKAVLAGSSAGGFGAAFNYDLFRHYMAGAKQAYLIDDSGPPLQGDEIVDGFRMSWYEEWNLGKTLDPLCPNCRSDFSQMATILGSRYPQDQMSLLESLQDKTISGYFFLAPASFQADLLDTTAAVLAPLPNFKYFYIDGNSHTMLFDPADYSVQNTTALQWITQMMNGDTTWKSLQP